MSQKLDILVEFPGLTIIHQKIPSLEVGQHEHDEHEFFLPLQGEISIQYSNQTASAAPGRMLYVPPDLNHSFSSSAQGSGERVILLIQPKLWQKHTNKDYSPLAFPTNSLAKELIFYLLIHPGRKGLIFFIAALMESLVDSLDGTLEQQASQSLRHLQGRIKDSRIKKAIELMEASPVTGKLSEIASDSGMSLRNFNRLFFKETGLNPKEYLMSRRMDYAADLLMKSQMTVTEIALETGYNSLSKFIQAFKRAKGVLPSDFRLLK